MEDQQDSPEFETQVSLLPFYVNGTLGAEARDELEEALRQSSALRAELEAEQAIATRIKTGGLAMTSSMPDNEGERLESLMGMIDGEAPLVSEPLRVSAETPSPDKVRSLMSYLNPRCWHPSVALTLAAAVVGQAAMLGGQASTIAVLEKENFELASGPCGENGKGAFLIELKEDANWKNVSALLDSEALTIVQSGDFGTLTLASPKKDTELTAQLERLRKSSLVASAEPVA